MSTSDDSRNRLLVDARRGRLPAVTLRTLAVGAISLGAVSGAPTLAATAVGVGLILYLWSMRGDESFADQHVFRWAGLAVLLILLVRISKPFERIPDAERARPIWLVLLVLAAGLAIGWGNRRIPRYLSIAAAMLAVVAITVTMTLGEWRSDSGLDVYWMHRGAGEALFQGENPYTDAVRVFNGSPYAPEGSIVEDYAYPPVVLGTYAVTAKAADPRLVSSVTWIAVLAWMAWHARRDGPEGDASYSMFLLMAGMAVWPVVWYASWTEPLSIGLLLLTAIWWRKKPMWSAIALGLAIASKQYFIFLAPLLLLQKGEPRMKRLFVSFGVALTTVLVGFVPDPNSYVTATILNLSDIGFRPDSQSLSGLLAANGIEIYLPAPIWVVLGLILALFVSRGSRSAADFVGRSALILGLVFYFGQAFMNYWFLVAAFLAIATVLSRSEVALSRQPVRRRIWLARDRPASAEPLR